jgi:hypothetical protein
LREGTCCTRPPVGDAPFEICPNPTRVDRSFATHRVDLLALLTNPSAFMFALLEGGDETREFSPRGDRVGQVLDAGFKLSIPHV